MKVRLVSFTQAPPEDPVHPTPKELVAFCARVSNPSNQANHATADKLIAYLLKHKHFSPFEMVHVCLEIETTRDIARQMLRHRSFTFQEFSQRYANPTQDLTFEVRQARLQDHKNRQNSIETDDTELQELWSSKQEKLIEHALETYRWALDNGLAKEVARAVLPEGLTMSRMYMNGSIRSWIHYLEVRTDESTQKEHREVALAIAQAIEQIFPGIR